MVVVGRVGCIAWTLDCKYKNPILMACIKRELERKNTRVAHGMQGKVSQPCTWKSRDVAWLQEQLGPEIQE